MWHRVRRVRPRNRILRKCRGEGTLVAGDSGANFIGVEKLLQKPEESSLMKEETRGTVQQESIS